jgi:hypothetical protein
MIPYDSSAGRKVESFQYSQSYTRSAGGHGTGRRVSFPSGRVSRSIRGIADSCLVVERRRTSDPYSLHSRYSDSSRPRAPREYMRDLRVRWCNRDGIRYRVSRAVAISDDRIFTKRIYTFVRMLGFDSRYRVRSILRRSGLRIFLGFSCFFPARRGRARGVAALKAWLKASMSVCPFRFPRHPL